MFGNFGNGFDGELPEVLNGVFTARDAVPDPRKETFCGMLKNSFFPNLTWTSFVTIVSIVDIVVFLAFVVISCLFHDGLLPSVFLGPQLEAYRLFDKAPELMQRELQVWRFVTPIFIHIGFSHLVFNVITQIIFGSLLEQMVGFGQMAGVYLISGFGGILFSSLLRDKRSVGASTADFGIFTGMLAVILVNWGAFDGND